jgi:hypothetical protein
MAMKSLKLNASTVTTSALKTLKDTIELAFSEEDGTPYVIFALTEGKGLGRQTVRLDQLEGMITALEIAIETGVEGNKKELTAGEMVDRTISLTDDNEVMFRATSGKGAKPTKCSMSEFRSVVRYLAEVAPQLHKMAEEA